ncbi:MAG TPA: hypothetical protein VGL20_17605 [Candidatus Dormibacteraeota bacterium]|jgi:hypothetical protein
MKATGFPNLDVKLINASSGGYDAIAKQFVADGPCWRSSSCSSPCSGS